MKYVSVDNGYTYRLTLSKEDLVQLWAALINVLKATTLYTAHQAAKRGLGETE
jgi:hypothetical protein